MDVEPSLLSRVMGILSISEKQAARLIAEVQRLYRDRMIARFTDLKLAERLKRTNPFLLRIRGAVTVKQWAETSVQSTLFASEEEAVGHVLEFIAKCCHPGSRDPLHPEDLDYEVQEDKTVYGFQVKQSWDCMPMSSRKNLSNTYVRLATEYGKQGLGFIGYFAPCYGRLRESSPPGQKYTTLSSRGFWRRVGAGDLDYDTRVGKVCALLCQVPREDILRTLVPQLVEKLASVAEPVIGVVGQFENKFP